MALNRENLQKYKKAEVRGGGSGSFSDVLTFKSGTNVDVQMAIVPPVDKDGQVFPEQEEGVFGYFKEVHRKLGKAAQQSCDCLKNYGEKCRVCEEARDTTITRFCPYVVLLREEKDEEGKHIGFTPISKPVVFDLPGKNGDTLVAGLFDEDNNDMTNLQALPVFKYVREGVKIDTTHTLTERPLKYTFNIAAMLRMDKGKDADGKKDIFTYQKEDTGNRVFETKQDLLDYISTNSATRFMKPSDVKMRVGLQGDDMYQKKEVLEALAGVSHSSAPSNTQSKVETNQTTETASNAANSKAETGAFNDDDDEIPF